jgi:hypothetical protein
MVQIQRKTVLKNIRLKYIKLGCPLWPAACKRVLGSQIRIPHMSSMYVRFATMPLLNATTVLSLQFGTVCNATTPKQIRVVEHTCQKLYSRLQTAGIKSLKNKIKWNYCVYHKSLNHSSQQLRRLPSVRLWFIRQYAPKHKWIHNSSRKTYRENITLET